ncbi:alpha-xylosidase [Cellulomonas sp. PhB150]|uniref:alpha-xylosidase n=1 Tax=Cellulomonas sp. PhB150 TaxID=2485188 RepID=UPI000F48B49D|nr:alpha-xylosidase [Cellulomonas sp. PhB150]ROS23193.1 alpha-D-xyloside xylohydrolase [Cellulomonas sp. PhB150]
MKFTDGYWQHLPGVTVLHPRAVADVEVHDDRLVVHSATGALDKRGDTLNRPLVSVTFTSPMDDVIGVRIEHHSGGVDAGPHFELASSGADVKVTGPDDGVATFSSGGLTARVGTRGAWSVDFVADGRVLTSSSARSVGVVRDAAGDAYVHEQLGLGVREHIFGLGERFGAFVKNGQSVDIWNADGGTSSEQAYKNVPFFLSDAGYGVFVDHPGHVSFEVGSEAVSRTQFSVAGEALQYYVVHGPTPKDVLRRYTALTGRPARVPAWSYGLWLSTSFTTSYDEATVTSFVDGMAERDLPLSVFHFDCFWMRAFHWSDFTWDPATFPDPEGMLARLRARGLKICVWINPYIAQRSALFEEGRAGGYLVTRADGSVWQTDQWQAGMGLVDFTNPAAVDWFNGHLRRLLGQGVDAFKTDFGERIPTDVVWHDGSDPQRMHNYYTHLYNKAVFDLLVAERGEGEAVLFARSATAGGQQFPVHWGGDCESTFVSMAESLRGGLSLAASGFGYWSHDIGGFEGTPDPAVFKRWLAFGLLSSHSRLHGSDSYRVPWAFDDEAVEITRSFTALKLSLMPYLGRLGEDAHQQGLPVMRPMVLEFPQDPGAATVDTQYMLGENLLVAPVFSASGDVDVYVPEGVWTSLLDGSEVTGPRWVHEQHGFESLPVYVRPDSVLPVGARSDRPDYDWADGVTLRLVRLTDGHRSVVRVAEATFVVTRTGDEVRVEARGTGAAWGVEVAGGAAARAGAGESVLTLSLAG